MGWLAYYNFQHTTNLAGLLVEVFRLVLRSPIKSGMTVQLRIRHSQLDWESAWLLRLTFSVVNSTMKNFLITVFLITCFTALGQEAKDTKIIVRTKAKDAKFIGTSMGGSMIIIRDAMTNEVLAKGVTEGGTGNTELLMTTPKERYTEITEGAASFETSISLQKPLFVTIEAISPVNHEEARVVSQTQVWLVPGKHMDGEGIILEIPGFVVDGLFPQTHQGFSIEKDKIVALKANIVMMCGCTISEGGTWDSETMEVEAAIYVNGDYWKTIPMTIAGENTFTATLTLEKTGSHEAIITAYHPISKNTGVDQLNFRVSN